MLKLGFSTQGVQIILKCVSSSSFSLLINGEVTSNIIPQRGLRLGCHLSPYLFILCTRALSSMLKKAEATNVLHGIQFDGAGLSIAHLLFADDSLTFAQADAEKCVQLKSILDIYSAASGQVISFEKSSILISPNASQATVNLIQRLLIWL